VCALPRMCTTRMTSKPDRPPPSTVAVCMCLPLCVHPAYWAPKSNGGLKSKWQARTPFPVHCTAVHPPKLNTKVGTRRSRKRWKSLRKVIRGIPHLSFCCPSFWSNIGGTHRRGDAAGRGSSCPCFRESSRGASAARSATRVVTTESTAAAIVTACPRPHAPIGDGAWCATTAGTRRAGGSWRPARAHSPSGAPPQPWTGAGMEGSSAPMDWSGLDAGEGGGRRWPGMVHVHMAPSGRLGRRAAL